MDTLRKSLLYRSEHRGMREADFIIGGFARRYLPQMSEDQLKGFEQLLSLPDQDLLNWSMGLSPPPSQYESDVMTMLINHVQSSS